MGTVLAILALLILIASFLFYYGKGREDAGATKNQSKSQEELLDVLKEDKRHHDRLASDPDERKRVRKKYTRSDK